MDWPGTSCLSLCSSLMLVWFLTQLWFRSLSVNCLVALHCMFVPQVILVKNGVDPLKPICLWFVQISVSCDPVLQSHFSELGVTGWFGKQRSTQWHLVGAPLPVTHPLWSFNILELTHLQPCCLLQDYLHDECLGLATSSVQNQVLVLYFLW